MSWTPILEGPAAARASEAIESLRRSIDVGEDPSLARGAAGVALLHAYLGDRAAARDALDSAVETVGARPLDPSLFLGFPGVAWALAHLREEDEEDAAEEADEALLEMLQGDLPAELVYGVAGIGVLAIERGTRRLVERCIERLEEGAPPWTSPASAAYPGGTHDLGVAHGIPGVIGFLGAARAAGFSTEHLLRPALDWLLSRRREAGGMSELPGWVLPDGRSVGSRTAWCYGDLGVAAVLLPLDRPAALGLARAAARRRYEETGVHDACLCHGAAGNAHLFNRLYQATGDGELRQAALSWYGRALDMGFLTLMPAEGGGTEWVEDSSLLTGTAGIALALQAAISEREPEWDRVFLLSPPTSRRGTPSSTSSCRAAPAGAPSPRRSRAA